MAVVNSLSLKIYEFKQDLVEFFQYGVRPVAWVFSFPLFVVSCVLLHLNRPALSFNLMSKVFRTGWAGSAGLGQAYLRYFRKRSGQFSALLDEFIHEVEPLPNTKKFFEHPEKFFNGVLLVLAPATEAGKGVIVLKYSYYFALFFKLFDVAKIAQRYHIVLEPSWAGYIDLSILCFLKLDEPVFVMTYEGRDKALLESLNSNLIPVEVGPNWWVNHNMFKAAEQDKDFDLIMVASWSKFKRHHKVFRSIAALNKKGHKLQLALVGYDGDLSLPVIEQMLAAYGLRAQTHIYNKVPPSEVAELLSRSKINLLWSRFEGNNRGIIEGMFCDVPCIVRKGHNYGEHYQYINAETGCFATDGNLDEAILGLLARREQMSPRGYVMSAHTYDNALDKLVDVIKANAEPDLERADLVAKVNELDGMKYLIPNGRERFTHDFAFIQAQILKQ